MNDPTGFERISEIQDEILQFTWEQVADKVDKFYVQGKVTDDDEGNVTSYEGNLIYMIVGHQVLKSTDIITKEEFKENAGFVNSRILELHNILIKLQGKSPVRFRWSVDTRTSELESEWTYYDDLTDEEKKDNWWEYWNADFAWRDQLQAELDAR